MSTVPVAQKAVQLELAADLGAPDRPGGMPVLDGLTQRAAFAGGQEGSHGGIEAETRADLTDEVAPQLLRAPLAGRDPGGGGERFRQGRRRRRPTRGLDRGSPRRDGQRFAPSAAACQRPGRPQGSARTGELDLQPVPTKQLRTGDAGRELGTILRHRRIVAAATDIPRARRLPGRGPWAPSAAQRWMCSRCSISLSTWSSSSSLKIDFQSSLMIFSRPVHGDQARVGERVVAAEAVGHEPDRASTSRILAAKAAGSAMNPPWSPGKTTGAWPSRSARATAERLAISSREASPIAMTTRGAPERS